MIQGIQLAGIQGRQLKSSCSVTSAATLPPTPTLPAATPCISASSCPLGTAYSSQDDLPGSFSVKTAAQPNAQHAIPWWLHAMQVLGASDSVKGKAVQHRLEMKGSIPPWVLDRFTGVIKDAHPAKFQVDHRN